MGKEDITDLVRFLIPYPDHIQQTALFLRSFVWDLYPESNELIYDNYNALAFGFSLSDTAGDAFCSIAVFSKHINFGFNRGSEIADTDETLLGNGSLYRYIRMSNINDFPEDYMKILLQDAYINASVRLKKGKIVPKGQTITKLMLPQKRRLK